MNSTAVYRLNTTLFEKKYRNGQDGKIEIANIQLDRESRQAWVNGKAIRLTVMEFDLICYLVTNQSRAVSRNELLRNIWGFESLVETRATDDMIKRLRKKLDLAGAQLKITTIWGYGFKIEFPSTCAGKNQESL